MKAKGLEGGARGDEKGEKGEKPPQFSQLGQQWGEVSCGGMEGNEGGLRQAG